MEWANHLEDYRLERKEEKEKINNTQMGRVDEGEREMNVLMWADNWRCHLQTEKERAPRECERVERRRRRAGKVPAHHHHHRHRCRHQGDAQVRCWLGFWQIRCSNLNKFWNQKPISLDSPEARLIKNSLIAKTFRQLLIRMISFFWKECQNLPVSNCKW